MNVKRKKTAPDQQVFSEEEAKLAMLFKALAHPARIRILKALSEHGECVCGEVVDVLPLAQSTVSQHLRQLKNAGLVVGEVEGVSSCYCIDNSNLKQMFDLILKFERGISTDLQKNLSRCC